MGAWIILILITIMVYNCLINDYTNWIRILMDNIYMKCKCKNTIPNGRLVLGFKVCVSCSSVEAYGCAPLINHKTGNSIQIMSKSDAEKIAKMTQRRGYGTMLSWN